MITMFFLDMHPLMGQETRTGPKTCSFPRHSDLSERLQEKLDPLQEIPVMPFALSTAAVIAVGIITHTCKGSRHNLY